MSSFATNAVVRRASQKRIFSWRGGAAARFLTGITIAVSIAAPQAAHAQWLAAPATNAFGTATNWTGSLVNGNFTGPSTFTTLSVAANQQITTGGNIVFSGATTPSYTLGLTPNAGSFATFSGASVQMLAGVTANQTINSGMYRYGGTGANTFSIITASAVGQTLTLNGDFNNVNNSGCFTAGLSNYYSLAGTGGNAVLNGIIGNGKDTTGAAVLGNLIVKKGGTANYTLNGVNTYTGGTEMGNGATGTVTLGSSLALGTGAIRVIGGTGTTGSGFLAGTALTGANAIANTFNYVGTTGTAVTSTFTAPTSGSNQVTITAAGTATPAVGDLIGGNLLGYFPNYTRVTAVSGTGVGAVITLSNAAAQTAGAALTGTTAAFNSAGQGTSTISGTNDIEFSGTQNLTTTNSNLTAATQTFNITNTGNTIFSGVLQQQGGTASVVKTGTGRLILSGANTYTGTTTVSGGELRLDNTSGSSAGTGSFIVNAAAGAATVSGSGTSSGLTTVTNANVLAPGDNAAGKFGTAGTLGVGTTGGATLTSAVLDFDLSSTFSSTNDLLTTGGALSLGTLAFNFNELTPGVLDTSNPYTLISGASSLAGFTGGYTTTFLNDTGAGYTAAYSVNGNNLQVQFTPIAAAPEPSQWAAFAIGLLGLGGLALKARRRTAQDAMAA